MKKVLIPILFILVIEGCSVSKSKVSACHESLQFKRTFFDNIAIVEKFTLEHQTVTKYTVNTESFLKSLKFISSRTKTSMGKVYNYQIGYPSLAMFEEDKQTWLNWYEANKCKKLK